MKIKAILFDFDFTLIDLTEVSLSSFNSALEKHNLRQITLEEMIRTWRLTWREVIKTQAPNEENVELLMELVGRDYMQTLKKTHMSYSKIYPGAYETLKELHEKGVSIAIVSRRFRKIIEEEVKKFKLKDFIDVIVGYEDVSKQKPAPDSINIASKRLGIPTQNCVVVGDSPSDVRAGNLAGAPTIAVLTGPNETEDICKEKPKAVINSIAELIPTLQRLGLISGDLYEQKEMPTEKDQ